MTRLAITGAAGRMGRMLTETIHQASGVTLVAAFEREEHELLGADVGAVAGLGAIGVPIAPLAFSDRIDVLIDFSIPEATLALLPGAAAAGTALVIGTTGFDDAGRAEIRATAERVAVLHAPNMSLGVNLTFKLVELAARVLGDDADVEVIEAHHRHKVDAPSGTALHMGEILAETLGRDLDAVAVYGREGHTGPRDRRTIGFETIRAGDIVGDHTVLFAGAGERLEITHRANSRLNFAQGALRAARFVASRERGLYDMQDVLGLRDESARNV